MVKTVNFKLYVFNHNVKVFFKRGSHVINSRRSPAMHLARDLCVCHLSLSSRVATEGVHHWHKEHSRNSRRKAEAAELMQGEMELLQREKYGTRQGKSQMETSP